MMARSQEQEEVRVSTGVAGLDRVLDGLRVGDNVVWRVDDIADYARFIEPFVEGARASGRTILYLRFGAHPPLMEAGEGVEVIELNAEHGFEAFTSRVYQLITDRGRGAYYVFDCLSDLLSAWATDAMIGYFFRVICPYLFQLETIACFALMRGRHAHVTLDRIRETTQVLLDVHRTERGLYVQPVKVWQRRSPTMFLPHAVRGDRFEPVISSSDATALQASLRQRDGHRPQRHLDFWDRLFLQASERVEAARSRDDIEPDEAHAATLDKLLRVMISRDERMLALARRYFTLEDLIDIRARMIGTGFIGGKALGMLLARLILDADTEGDWDARLDRHDSFYVASDVYYAYLVHNDLWPLLMRQRANPRDGTAARALRSQMLKGTFPREVRRELQGMLDYFGQYPILVRSSSLLEDGFGSAFAGKYESRFLVNQGSPQQRYEALEQAVRDVFASTMSEDALAYRAQRGLLKAEEPMALLVQRVNGIYRGEQGQFYLPDIAGVGVSRNIFAWSDKMDPSAGMLRVVMGLGTRAVDRIEGDHACVVALDEPTRRPFHDDATAHRYSQHDIDLLDVDADALNTVPLDEVADPSLGVPIEWVGERDHEAMRRLEDRGDRRPVWRLSFMRLLSQTDFVPTMRRMLGVLEKAYDYPVDIEFTGSIEAEGRTRINLVQCRPLQTLGRAYPVEVPTDVPEHRVLFTSQGSFMGGNIDHPISRVILVDGGRYGRLTTAQRYEVAQLVGQLTRDAPAEASIMLIGPGRWGTSTPALGVPTGFADIARAAVLVEVADMGGGLVPDLSFGSHFFQDLVEARIAYVALFPGEQGCLWRPQWLSRRPHLAPHDHPDVSPEAAAAVDVVDTAASQLRLIADIRSQQVLCFGSD